MNLCTYTFIHPTKTGGTACERFFADYYSSNIKGGGHKTVCTDQNNPIIIVRDVYSRFISMFMYWKYGSKMYTREVQRLDKNKDKTILDYINLILENNTQELCMKFLSQKHYSPLTTWINTDYKNIIVVRYEKNLNPKIQNLLKMLNIPNKGVLLPEINPSIKNINDITFCEEHKKEITDFINVYFKSDIELLHQITQNPSKFKMVL